MGEHLGISRLPSPFSKLQRFMKFVEKIGSSESMEAACRQPLGSNSVIHTHSGDVRNLVDAGHWN
jgi:hypothetical protein